MAMQKAMQKQQCEQSCRGTPAKWQGAMLAAKHNSKN